MSTFRRLLCMLAVLVLALASTANAQEKHSIRDALADAIVINANSKANRKWKHDNVAPDSVVPAAKTKNFAYTSISVPRSSPSGRK